MNAKKRTTYLDNFIEYLSKNKGYVLSVFIICIAVYGIWMFNDFVTTDAELMYATESASSLYTSWVALGRWGLVLLKKVCGVWIVNPFFALGVFFVCFPLSGILWNYVLLKWMGKEEDHSIGKLVFDLIYLTCPIWAYQFAFRNQIGEVSFFLMLLPCAMLLLSAWLEGKNIGYAVIAFALLVFIFSGYQAFLILYGEAVLFYFGIAATHEKIGRKQFYIRLLKAILFTIAAYAVYQLSVNVVADYLNISREGYSDYLLGQIPWLEEGFAECFARTLAAVKDVFFGTETAYTVVYSIEFVIAVIFFIGYCFKKGTLKIWTGIILLLVFAEPLALTVLTAGAAVLRQQFAYVLALAAIGSFEFRLLYRWFEERIPKALVQGIAIILLLWFLVPQAQLSTRLLYTNYRVAQEDYAMMDKIYAAAREKGAQYGDAIVLVGGQTFADDDTIIREEATGISFIEWASVYPKKTLQAMRAYGLDVSEPTAEQTRRGTKIAQDLPCWPDEDAVYVEEGLIVVRLG